jgi:hypothetical protein
MSIVGYLKVIVHLAGHVVQLPAKVPQLLGPVERGIVKIIILFLALAASDGKTESGSTEDKKTMEPGLAIIKSICPNKVVKTDPPPADRSNVQPLLEYISVLVEANYFFDALEACTVAKQLILYDERDLPVREEDMGLEWRVLRDDFHDICPKFLAASGIYKGGFTDKIKNCFSQAVKKIDEIKDPLTARRAVAHLFGEYHSIWGFFSITEWAKLRRRYGPQPVPDSYPHKTSKDRYRAFRKELMASYFKDAWDLLIDEFTYASVGDYNWGGYNRHGAAMLVNLLEHYEPSIASCHTFPANTPEELKKTIDCHNFVNRYLSHHVSKGSEEKAMLDYHFNKQNPLLEEVKQEYNKILQAKRNKRLAKQNSIWNSPKNRRKRLQKRICRLKTTIKLLSDRINKENKIGRESGFVDASKLYSLTKQKQSIEESLKKAVKKYKKQFKQVPVTCPKP